MIELKNVSKNYPVNGGIPVPAITQLSLKIARGQFVIITGRSGSGKTTLLNLIAGLAHPSSGSVLFDGHDLSELAETELASTRNRQMGFVFQFPSLLPSLNILENVMVPALFARPYESDLRRRAADLLDMVGLSSRLSAFPRQLSAGQQQRAVIARSLINRPEVILADEPTSNLDKETEREVISILEKLYRVEGLTVVMVTHDTPCDLIAATRIEMAEGKILCYRCGDLSSTYPTST